MDFFVVPTVTYKVHTWPRQTLLVKSKTRGKAILHTMLEGPRYRGHSAGETHVHGVGY